MQQYSGRSKVTEGQIVVTVPPSENPQNTPTCYDEHLGDRRDAYRAVHTEVVMKGKGF